MKQIARHVAATAIVGIVSATLALATPYTLRGTTYSEGCVDPCLCPIVLYPEVDGGFELEFESLTQEFYTLRVEGMHFTVRGFEGEIVQEARGSGTYRVRRGGREHEMTLELDFGGVVERYGSGLVERTSSGRDIDILVSRGSECFDVWIDVSARPE